ncbi:hypothetical protein M0811_10547 [Anaeramoeba ignava]|uniref:Uncharacterized protein n=1 Tax=Anaeramoeba ignava TaxID=1746090 RepID=A0A9Q0LF35_ANAIG|nr:hypothetical protein M0811_10547 [Anaeramoeba ignava]
MNEPKEREKDSNQNQKLRTSRPKVNYDSEKLLYSNEIHRIKFTKLRNFLYQKLTKFTFQKFEDPFILFKSF